MEIYRVHFDLIASTNSWAKEHLGQLPLDALSVVSADQQSCGRGQFNRKWLSPKGGLYVSFVYFLDRYPDDTGLIGQKGCDAVLELLSDLGIRGEKKFPNDVLIHGEKVCGILCETLPFEGKVGVIVGIGLNVNVSEDWLSEVDQPATSLHLHTKNDLLEGVLLEKLTNILNKTIDK